MKTIEYFTSNNRFFYRWNKKDSISASQLTNKYRLANIDRNKSKRSIAHLFLNELRKQAFI